MATHMDATLQTGLQADSPLVFFAVEILFPGFNLRLLDGPGTLTINSNTFVGLDATYGTLMLPENFTDGIAAEAPHLVLGIFPPTNTASAAICEPSTQGSQVSMWFGAVNRSTGALIGTPYLCWKGQLDTAVGTFDRNQRFVKIDAESSWDRLFDQDEGILLDNATHQMIWPGELGLEYITNVQYQIPWGLDGPRPNVVADGSLIAPSQASTNPNAAWRDFLSKVAQIF